MQNIYQPDLMEVVSVRQQTNDVKSARIRFADSDRNNDFAFRVGQFGIFSAFGYGESPFNICSSSHQRETIEFCFRRTGRVTEALWQIEPGDTIGFRGPYGSSYPMEQWQGKNLIFIAGGIAMPPIRCAILDALADREKYGEITIVYGARTVADLVYPDELDAWSQQDGVQVITCVDPGGQTDDFKGEVGFVPQVVERAELSADNAVALVIGPPVMIRYTLPILANMGMADTDIYTSLENRMKCGVGKCGRCNCGPAYVCKDGPVFNLAQLKELPET